ncbi:MAG TPA: phytanoyl-CoA dioxygenase family protein [Candidatus Binataceae bacterium]|nr:phytanoyl-CoA dioxygenase family protein [Candidatus Binataceae bacterium]
MNRQLKRPISDQELRTYHRDGVVWLRGILDVEWPRRLGDAIDELIERRDDKPDDQVLDLTGLAIAAESDAEKAPWPAEIPEWGSPRQLAGRVAVDTRVKPGSRRGHFVSVTSAWQLHPAIRALAIDSPLPELAALLSGSTRLYLYDDQLLVKPPGTMERTAWHQDQGYDHIAGDKVCAIRVPTGRETPETGLIQYLRGSHQSGVIYKVNYFISNATASDDGGEPIPQIEGHEADFDIVTFAPEPGDVVAHHLRTLHGAAGNSSATATRRAVTFRYAGDDVRYMFRKFAPPGQRPSHLRDGDSLDLEPERHPVVWPRPSAQPDHS